MPAITCCAAAAFEPKVSKSEISPPSGLVYFNDSSVLLLHTGSDILRSTNNGVSWDKTLDNNKVSLLIEHPFDKDRAYAITNSDTHFATSDRGETWRKFTTGKPIEDIPISFHAEKPDWLLFGSKDGYYVSKNGFKKVGKLVDANRCEFGKSSPEFEQDGIVCAMDEKLSVSRDFFKTSKDFDNIKNVIGVGATGRFFVAASKRDLGVELYVSTDLKEWNIADFGEITRSYTILESSKQSLHVDVYGHGTTGTLYVSDSSGTKFTKSLDHTRRNRLGLVDIEKVENVDGILIANVVEDGVQSRISYDDGRSWHELKAGNNKNLHLHSVTDHQNVGRIFSSPAPGILAGIGNTGKNLGREDHGDMYISHDNGLTWKISHADAQMYEFGDQGNLMIATYRGFVDKAFYSLDRGDSWDEFKLGNKVHTRFLFTTPDSTSLNFVLIGENDKDQFVALNIDFDGIFNNKKCKMDSDFEKWYARYDEDGNPSCLMGQKQYFWRKKTSAKCIVGDLYHEQHASSEPCECTGDDFECDYEFENRNVKCYPKDFECKEGETITRKSGLRKKPGNKCKGNPPKEVEETCQISTAENSKISHNEFKFDGQIFDYFYLPAKDDKSDETILLRTTNHKLFVTHDQGGKWEELLPDEVITGMFPHPDKPDEVYLITPHEQLYVTRDRAHNFDKFDLPGKPAMAGASPIFSFHQTKNWIIYHAEKGCDSVFGFDCRLTSYYSTDGGKHWKEMVKDVNKCKFAPQTTKKEKLVICEKLSKNGHHLETQLISSENWFKTSKKHFSDIIGFAFEYEFIVVAVIDPKEQDSLNLQVSVDGENYALARFPHNFKINKQQAYTILESVTHSIFVHVTASSRPGGEYGTLLKSNSNGTDYVQSLEFVNRNGNGYVDYEKMEGLEGVAIVNVVSNDKQVKSGERKKLKTMITHNDGGEWNYLSPPKTDADGKRISCSSKSLEKCSLNLHGYTEREDYRDTFSSESAVGLMIGVGNVGPELTALADANTYLTRDGGIVWNEIAKGEYMWEFGDSGAIVVIVDHHEPTNAVKYSLDEGLTWEEYKFSEDQMKIEDIATIPSDQSRKFILTGKAPRKEGDKSIAIQIDFTGLTDRKCNLDMDNPDNDDFELWSPSHPNLEGCLFGHKALYHRKIPDRNCFIGRKIDQPHEILQNCTCTRQDFECDFNYYRANDGSCQLVSGFSPPDHSRICKEMPGTVEYWEPTGYRRIPLTTCKGGKELDKVESQPCPGQEEKYEEKHRGLHGFALFVVIVLPIGMAAVICVIVWDHYSKRYGQIRLGEENDDQPIIIRYLAIGVAGVVAVASIIPSVIKSIYGQIKSRIGRSSPLYNSRSAFRQYTAVPEEELLREDDLDMSD